MAQSNGLNPSFGGIGTFGGISFIPTPIVATAAGKTINSSGSFVTTTNTTDANDIIILPAPTVGTVVHILVGAQGCELRSSAPTTVGINGGTGASFESALGANTHNILTCVTTTAWTGVQISTVGAITAVAVAD